MIELRTAGGIEAPSVKELIGLWTPCVQALLIKAEPILKTVLWSTKDR